MKPVNNKTYSYLLALSFVSYLMGFVYLYYNIKLGLVQGMLTINDFVYEAIVIALFHLLLIFLNNYKAKDGSNKLSKIMFLQNIFTIFWISYLSFYLEQNREFVFSLYALIVFYASLTQSVSTIVAITVLSIVSFASSNYIEHLIQPSNFHIEKSIVQVISLSYILSIFAYLTTYIKHSHLQLESSRAKLELAHKKLSHQKEDLEFAYKNIQSTVKNLGEAATRDALTGLFNRRQFVDLLNSQVTLSQGTSHSFCLAMLDLDHFKSVNDTFGHPVGDEVLSIFSKTAQQMIRHEDILGRYGGEEFILLMPNVNKIKAASILERIRSGIENLDLTRIHPDLSITVSIGLTKCQNPESTEEIMSRADKALYEAKARGRNRILFANQLKDFGKKPVFFEEVLLEKQRFF